MYSFDEDLIIDPEEQQIDTDLSSNSTDTMESDELQDGNDDPDDGSPDLSAEPKFGGYSGTYSGIKNCWYSSDGRVYDSAGNCVGTH